MLSDILRSRAKCAARHLPAIAALLLAANDPAAAKGAVPIPANQPVAGISQTELSQRWWQWANSFDDDTGPVADRTGTECARGQQGAVWFLAGAYGSRRVVRTCHVPAGKTLFFPLLNFVVYSPPGATCCCQSLISNAAEATDRPSALIFEIDHMRFFDLDAHRLVTDCFSLQPGGQPDAAANGYYVAIGPLSRGRHKLEFGGILPSLTQAITYTLVVD